VRTREGKKALVAVPPGTVDGARLRLGGLGYEDDGRRGDQIVIVRVRPAGGGEKEKPTRKRARRRSGKKSAGG
jgi:hypothetical protein